MVVLTKYERMKQAFWACVTFYVGWLIGRLREENANVWIRLFVILVGFLCVYQNLKCVIMYYKRLKGRAKSDSQSDFSDLL